MSEDELETAIHRDPLSGTEVVLRAPPDLAWTDERGARSARVDRRAIVGSAAGVDVEIRDPAVSRLHAELEALPDGLWVRDLKSRNGTFIENVRVDRARLDPGARLRVGTTQIAIAYRAQPAPVELWPHDGFGPLVGRSATMRELFATLARVAATDSTVLVEGETGTGKELVARAIHEASARAKRPYVIVDCAAIAEALLEAELFGHAKGAFTGAVAARHGALLEADGGTVFLDEIGELPLDLQPKLLRFLESRTVRRVGESQVRPVDVRVIAATHRDLRERVNDGSFREDLYFRLAVIPVWVPPLRERREDVPMLIARFAPDIELPSQTLAALAERPWRGNVRELRNVVERVIALGERALGPPAAKSRAAENFPEVRVEESFKDIRERWTAHLEREYLTKSLARHRGNVSAVAKAAGLDRSYVYRLILKHGL